MTSADMIDTGESEIGCEVWGHKYVITSLLEIAVCGNIKTRCPHPLGNLYLPSFTTTRHVCLGGALARPCTISVGVLVTPSESLTRRGCQDSGTASDSGGVDT